MRFGQVMTYCLEEEGFRLVAAEFAGLSVRGLEIAACCPNPSKLW